MNFGERLHEARTAAGLSQEELGKRAAVTSKFISKIENGHAAPSVDVANRLMMACGLRSMWEAAPAPEQPPIVVSISRAWDPDGDSLVHMSTVDTAEVDMLRVWVRTLTPTERVIALGLLLTCVETLRREP